MKYRLCRQFAKHLGGNMKRFFNWLIVNGIFAGLFIAGIYYDVYGFILLGNTANTVFTLLTIFVFLLMWVSDTLEQLVDDSELIKGIEQFKEANKPRPIWLKILDPIFDVSILLFFAYFSLYYSLICYFIAVTFQHLTLLSIKK